MKRFTFCSLLDWVNHTGLIFLILGCSLLVASSAVTNEVTVAWDANPPSDVVTGYVIYYGETAGTVTNDLKVASPTLQGTLTNLVWDAEYFFFVTATNALGLESDPSLVLTYKLLAEPTVPNPPQAVEIELKLRSGTQVLGPFTNEVATIKYRYALPVELFVADISSIEMTEDINASPLTLLPPTPGP